MLYGIGVLHRKNQLLKVDAFNNER